jgi:hypothetical protein
MCLIHSEIPTFEWTTGAPRLRWSVKERLVNHWCHIGAVALTPTFNRLSAKDKKAAIKKSNTVNAVAMSSVIPTIPPWDENWGYYEMLDAILEFIKPRNLTRKVPYNK